MPILNLLQKTMVFAAVIVTNLFNGLNTAVWTAWIFFSVFIGIVLVVIYTVSCYHIHGDHTPPNQRTFRQFTT